MTDDPTIEQLFTRFRTYGAPEALAAVFDRTAPRLLLLAAHVTPDQAAAEDLLQETFLQAMERAAQWDPSRPLLPWLGGILRHRAQDLTRRQQLRRGPDVADVVAAAPGPKPDEGAATAELLGRVQEAMAALASPYREALVLRITHGLQPTEIAHALGRPPATVRVQLKRGLELLRGSLPASLAGALAVLLVAERGLAAVRQAVFGGGRVVAAGTRSTGGFAAAIAALGFLVAGGWWMLRDRVPLAPTVVGNGVQDADPTAAAQGRDGAAAAAPRRDEANPGSASAVAAASTLRGRLVDAVTGAPVAGGTAKVSFGRGRFVTADPDFRTYPAPIAVQAKADGAFAVTFTPAREMRVRLALGALGHFEIETEWTSVRSGIDADLGVIAMPRGADVRLRVVDEHAVPLPDLRIDVTRHEAGATVPEPFWAWSMIEDRSDREGYLSLRSVPAPGSYSFAVGRGVSSYRVVRGSELAVAEQTPITADIVVGPSDPKDAMAGRVVDEHGVPVAGVTLSVAAEFLDLGSGVSGPDGTFRLDLGVPGAERELYLPADERRFHLLEPDRVYARGATDLVVRVARNPAFDVPLQVVRARTGEPVTSYGVAWVLDYWTEAMRLSMPPDRIYRPVAAEPHADGRTTLPGLLPGRYRACIWPGDRDLATSYLVPFEVEAGGAEPVCVEVDGRAPLRVTLCDETGAPIVGAEVGLVHLLLNEDGYPSVFSVEQFARGVGGGRDTAIQLQSGVTDSGGRVVLQAPIGEARLQLRVQDARCAGVAQALAAVPPAGADVVVTAQRCARIVGRLGPAEWVASVAPDAGKIRDDAIVRPEDSDLVCYCPVVWIEGIGENAPRGTRGFVMPDGTFHIDSVLPGDYRLMCGPDTCAWPGPRGGAIAFGELRGLVGGEVREVVGDASAHLPARLRGTVLVDGQPWTRGRFGLAYRDDDRMRHGLRDVGPGGTFECRVNPGSGYLPFVEWEDATGEHRLFADRRIDVAPGADLATVFAFERHVGQLTAPKPGKVRWRALDFPEVHALLGEWVTADAQGVATFDPAPPGRIEFAAK